MRLNPFNDYILVQPDAPEEKVGSIYVADPKKSTRGKVLAVGNKKGTEEEPLLYPEVGSRILFSDFAGIEVDGNLLLKPTDILATIEDG